MSTSETIHARFYLMFIRECCRRVYVCRFGAVAVCTCVPVFELHDAHLAKQLYVLSLRQRNEAAIERALCGVRLAALDVIAVGSQPNLRALAKLSAHRLRKKIERRELSDIHTLSGAHVLRLPSKIARRQLNQARRRTFQGFR
jgi:hypothetical protein